MTEVIAGQPVTLLGQFYDFQGGSLTDLDATPTITITSIASGATALAATSSGVTHPGTGSYGYAWTPAATLAGGDYLATWSGLKSGSPVTAAETVTVIAAYSGTAANASADGICYCTREQVMRALDVKGTARSNAQIDRAIRSARDDVDGQMHRVFYPTDATKRFDWPNFQYAYPWRLWLDQWELAAVPTAVTSGGVQIPLSACNFEPVNSGPPYNYLELRRDQPYSFGVGSTPQRDIAITGTWAGCAPDTDPAGQLTAAISTTTATTVIVTDGSLVGVGDLLIVDSERMLVTDRASNDTGQTLVSGATTANPGDNALSIPDGTQVHVDEVIQLDSERMLIYDITGNTATVKRAWDGTVLATHSAGVHVYAFRTLTVRRGMLGTTAATHASATACAIHRVPGLIKDLAVAEAENRLLQEISGYARSTPSSSGNSKQTQASLDALNDLRDRAYTAHGRKNRQRVI
ncbi:hypothetical protein [Streptomyces sp. NPDC091215]|uniref:hypothetical protein n=1 Tax=Streptomyces sp. NPDC091215 TaxID=3155192 RepID=UPI00341D955B